MPRPRLRPAVVLLAFSAILLARPTRETRLVAEDAIRGLQKIAEKQGHPKAAVKALKKLGYRVPPDVEAEAAGITPENLRQAVDQGGPLGARLETARGKKLTADQSRRIAEAEREHARQVQPLRRKLSQDVASITGLPEAKVRKILARDQGAAASQKQTIAQLEKQLGRPLSAADAKRVNAARDKFHAELESQRSDLAGEVGRIVGVPQFVVQELLQ